MLNPFTHVRSATSGRIATQGRVQLRRPNQSSKQNQYEKNLIGFHSRRDPRIQNAISSKAFQNTRRATDVQSATNVQNQNKGISSSAQNGYVLKPCNCGKKNGLRRR